MGIRFFCPHGHKVHVKTFQAGQRGFCPTCTVGVQIPTIDEAKAAGQLKLKAAHPVGAGASRTSPAGSRPDVGPEDHDELPDESGPIDAVSVDAASSVPGPPHSATSKGTRLERPPVDVAKGVTPAASDPTELTKSAGSADQRPAAGPREPDRSVRETSDKAASPPTVAVKEPPLFDPIAENPSLQWYVRPPSGGQFGPARGDLLLEWIGQGRVAAQAYVWREDWAEWKHAKDALPQIRARLVPAGPVQPPLPPAGPSGLSRPEISSANPSITGLTSGLSTATGSSLARPQGTSPSSRQAGDRVALGPEDVEGGRRSRSRRSGLGLQIATVVGLGAVAVVLVVVLTVVLTRNMGSTSTTDSRAARTGEPVSAR